MGWMEGIRKGAGLVSGDGVITIVVQEQSGLVVLVEGSLLGRKCKLATTVVPNTRRRQRRG
jgi:hypothetical protein